MNTTTKHSKVLILGSGPAGYTDALRKEMDELTGTQRAAVLMLLLPLFGKMNRWRIQALEQSEGES